MRDMFQENRRSRTKFKVLFIMALLTILCMTHGANINNANDPKHIFGEGNKQISDINLLLPISTCVDCRKVVFNISAINGCYNWEVSHSNMIQIQQVAAPGYPECSNIVQVQPVALKASKSIVWISARDRNTGQVLRCEAKLSAITRLEVLTHLRQFYVDDYEHLHVTGFDEEGNVFNSLEGLRFEWTIERGNDIVKIVTMKESSHKSSEVKREMEFSKLHSDSLFLKGLRTGTATISVKINEPGYEHVQLSQVTLTITEPFIIIPSNTVYLLPTSNFQFQLAKVSLREYNITQHPITLPNSQYEWNLHDGQQEKGFIGEDGLFTSLDKEGLVNVIVSDRLIPNNTAESSVKVVFPSMLDIDIVDVTEQITNSKTLLIDDFLNPYSKQLGIQEWDNNWVLVEDHYYLMKIQIYDKDKHLIQLTDNLVFNNLINDEYFDIIKINKIKSEFVVRAKKQTIQNKQLLLVSTLQQIISQRRPIEYPFDQSRLKSEKEVRITGPVSIIHPTDLVLLPYLRSDDENKNGEQWQLRAEGGTGFYQWSIENPNIAQISGLGLVRSKEIGQSKIVVRDNMNIKNIARLNLEVIPISALVWLEDHLEIEKKIEIGQLNIIALDKFSRKFTNCTGANIQFDIKGEGIITSVPTHHSYSQIRKSVLNNKDLMFTSQLFLDNPNAITIQHITNRIQITDQREELLLHNNFGICGQQQVSAIGQGLGRAKAFFSQVDSRESTKFTESNYAEIAAYDKLQTVYPNYNLFFSNLYSASQNAQEEKVFTKFYENNTFDIAFGSSLQWIIQGGTNFWKDIQEKYQVQEDHILINKGEGGLNQELLKFEKVEEMTTNFKYSLHCQGPRDRSQLSRPHRFKVTLKQQNMLTRQLLRPAVHNITIDLHCEPPQSEQLFWSQNQTEMVPLQAKHLPRYKVISGDKNHYALVNSRHYIRYLFFDNSNFVFFNSSSIYNDLVSSNEQMLKLFTLKDNYEDQVNDNSYDMRLVEIKNITGTVYIHANAKGYYKSYLDDAYFRVSSIESLLLTHEVKDSMRIEVVKNLDLQPKYKSIYLSKKGNSFKFKINHGSGHFIVHINNTDLAEMHHSEGEITIYPKKEGGLEISVEDAEIPGSEITTAELLISDIARLEIDAPGSLIESGSQMELHVTAFDIYGNEFDEDQYPHMEFSIEIENTGVKRLRELTIDGDSTNNRKFIAKGNEPGTYQVTAFTYKHTSVHHYYQSHQSHHERQRVTSDMLRIEVFSLLEIHPGSLLLTPEMRYTLQIVGGPSKSGSVEIKFEVEDQSIATVDVFREVTGKLVGDTKLYYEIIQLKQGKNGSEKRSIISKKTIPIRVRLVTDIEIPYNNQRQIYSTSMIKLIGILKYNQETFTHGIAPISYNWNCSNPNILAIQYPTKSDGSAPTMINKKVRDNIQSNNYATFYSSFNSSTVYGLASKSGEALVTLSLAIEYPDQYNHDKNWFSVSIITRVHEKLAVEVPEFINLPDKSTHLYLMPPNTYNKIETNKKTRLRLGYSLQSVFDYSSGSYKLTESTTPMIKLVNDEAIMTLDKYGKVTVIIEENQQFSDQVVMLNVLITDIFNIASKDVYQVLNFPLGSIMQIPIKFQNEHSHQFAHNIEGISLGFELSHPRVATAKLDYFNQTLTLQAEGSGECNVVVYLVDHPHIYDIFRVKVSSMVQPSSPVQLHMGGHISFKIRDKESFQSPQDGLIWSSSNPSVIDVNQKSGEARGLQEGKAEIHLNNNMNAVSIVHVSKVKHAEIDEKSRKSMLLSTEDPKNDLRVRLKLYLNDQVEELTPSVQYDGMTLIKQNVGLVCESEFPNHIKAKIEISEIEGFFCVLSFIPGTSLKDIPKSTQVYVSAYAPNPSDPQNVNAAFYKDRILQFEVQIISNIKVESQYRKGLTLNKNRRTVDIKIYSNVPVQATIENNDEQDKGYELVKYRVSKSDDAKNEYIVSLSIPREITHQFSSQLILTHPTTNKKISLPISFTGQDGSSYDSQRYDSEDEGEGFFEKIGALFTSSKHEERVLSGDRHDDSGSRHSKKEKQSFAGYFVMGVLIILILMFLLIAIFGFDPSEVLKSIWEGRLPRKQQQRRQYVAPSSKTYVREPISRPQFQNIPNQNFFKSPTRAGGLQQQTSMMQQSQASVQPPRMNLGTFQYSGQRQSDSDLNKSSMFETSPRRRILR